MFSPVAWMMKALPSIGMDPMGIMTVPSGASDGEAGETVGMPEDGEELDGEAEAPDIMLEGAELDGEAEALVIMLDGEDVGMELVMDEAPVGMLLIIVALAAEGIIMLDGEPEAPVIMADGAEEVGMLLVIIAGVASAGIILLSMDSIIGLPEA